MENAFFSMKFEIESLLVRIRRFQRQIAQKSPYEKWIFTRDIMQIFFKWTLCPVIDKNLKINWYNWLGAINYAYLLFLISYTVYLFRDDPFSWTRCLYLYGSIIPVIIITSICRSLYIFSKYIFYFFIEKEN